MFRMNRTKFFGETKQNIKEKLTVKIKGKLKDYLSRKWNFCENWERIANFLIKYSKLFCLDIFTIFFVYKIMFIEVITLDLLHLKIEWNKNRYMEKFSKGINIFGSFLFWNNIPKFCFLNHNANFYFLFWAVVWTALKNVTWKVKSGELAPYNAWLSTPTQHFFN